MKGRTWVLFFIVIVASFIGLYTVLFPIFKLDTKARDYLVERITNLIGSKIDISAVSLSPGFVQLKQVKLYFHDSPVIIEARSIRIGYNIKEMVKNQFRPVYGAEQIIVDHPWFIWLVNESDSASALPHLKNIPEINLKGSSKNSYLSC